MYRLQRVALSFILSTGTQPFVFEDSRGRMQWHLPGIHTSRHGDSEYMLCQLARANATKTQTNSPNATKPPSLRQTSPHHPNARHCSPAGRRFIQGRTASRAPDSSHIYIWVPPRPAVPTCYPCVAHPHAAPKSCALLGYERAGVKNGALFSRVPSPADPNPGSSRTLLASADRTWARIRQVSGTPEVIPSWRARESRGWF